jgi:hypothetical protein
MLRRAYYTNLLDKPVPWIYLILAMRLRYSLVNNTRVRLS